MRKLLLAMGSEILMDEGVSIMLARDLKQSFQDFEMLVQPAGGMELIELLAHFNLVVIIDTCISKETEPGKITLFKALEDAATLHLQNPHDTGFSDSMKLAVQLGYHIPEKIVVLGIGIRQHMVASSGLSQQMNKNYRNLLKESSEIVERLILP